MTEYLFILKSLVEENGGIDAYLRKLYAMGLGMMISARCFSIDSTRRTIKVEKAGNEQSLCIYQPGHATPETSCPTSLIACIVNWDVKKTVWRRDAKTHQVPVVKRKKKAKEPGTPVNKIRIPGIDDHPEVLF